MNTSALFRNHLERLLQASVTMVFCSSQANICCLVPCLKSYVEVCQLLRGSDLGRGDSKTEDREKGRQEREKRENGEIRRKKEGGESPSQVVELVGASAHAPKGYGFNPQLGYL